ncbi:MAG: glycosyltransferase family 2 protein [Mediterraneibacter gnavus]
MKPQITVFTPAYNRAYSLHLCYESLCSQNNKNFIWLIVDDGSTDNTRELVEEWKKNENGFEIKYVYKKNGGMHTAHNTAYEIIETELNVCIDSDDYLAEDAIEKVLTFWNQYGSKKYAGVIGLDATFDNQVIGEKFDDSLKTTTLGGYYSNGGRGDKKLVYRTEIMKKYPPYPEFEGEKYVSLGYKYLLCDQEYELLVLNEILCNVEYQLDGSSTNMFRQYLNNPKGFAFFRKTAMQCYPDFKRRFIENIHYVSSSILAKNKKFLSESPKKGMTFLAIPFGILLTYYIKKKSKDYMIVEGMKK